MENHLTALPPEIRYLTHLRSLDLTHNPLSIPDRILKGEPGAIIQYYLHHRDHLRKPLKVVLVEQISRWGACLIRPLRKRLPPRGRRWTMRYKAIYFVAPGEPEFREMIPGTGVC